MKKLLFWGLVVWFGFVLVSALFRPTTSPPPTVDRGVTSQAASGSKDSTGLTTSRPMVASECLKIDSFDSSVLSSNDVFTELAWKADVTNSCPELFLVRVNFTIYDKDEFKLDSDREDDTVPANGVGKARGKMLVSPPEKARRMSRQGVSITPR